MTKTLSTSTTLVLTWVNSAKIGKHIAKTIVKEGLASVSNVIPRVTTFNAVADHVQSLQEVMVLAHAVKGKTVELSDRIQMLHPYESPQIRIID